MQTVDSQGASFLVATNVGCVLKVLSTSCILFHAKTERDSRAGTISYLTFWLQAFGFSFWSFLGPKWSLHCYSRGIVILSYPYI